MVAKYAADWPVITLIGIVYMVILFLVLFARENKDHESCKPEDKDKENE